MWARAPPRWPQSLTPAQADLLVGMLLKGDALLVKAFEFLWPDGGGRGQGQPDSDLKAGEGERTETLTRFLSRTATNLVSVTLFARGLRLPLIPDPCA
jgi:hypothetical protein